MTDNLLRQLHSSAAGFDAALDALLDRDTPADRAVEETVRNIVRRIREQGDSALCDYTQQFDGLSVDTAAELEMPRKRLCQAFEGLDKSVREALETAAQRIRQYHQKEAQQSWDYSEADGTRLGQKITPLDRVGIYVPGGKAAYPSSVLMTALPAQVAGVGDIFMTVPTPRGEVNEAVLAAAWLAGVDRVFTIGGAQAVAALAFGTATVPRVDKIVGPGNIYVATAKKQVFGQVGIDMIAGPSEVVVICDDSAEPEWAAMDLFAQAEHDELAQSILITDSMPMAEAVQRAVVRLLPELERQEIIQPALLGQGAVIVADSLDQAAEISNRIAPEHLELMLAEPLALVDKIRHAGAIFVGRYSAEALGDYCAGPNHVLPTAGTARFSSPLGVYDFQKRSSLIHCTAEGADTMGRVAATLGYCEGLTAHARAAEYRLTKRN